MLYMRFFIIAFLLLVGFTASAQIPFDSTLVVNQKRKLYPLYQELMNDFSKIKIYDEGKDIIREGVIPSPRKNAGGEATFIFEVSDEGELINVYMTEFWYYAKNAEVISVRDYIVFVDQDNLGFDHNRIKQHDLREQSMSLIDFLFDYVKTNKKFNVIEPRERNLKYQRVRFE